MGPVLYLMFMLFWLARYRNALSPAYPDVIGHKYANDVALVYYMKIENSFADRGRAARSNETPEGMHRVRSPFLLNPSKPHCSRR